MSPKNDPIDDGGIPTTAKGSSGLVDGHGTTAAAMLPDGSHSILLSANTPVPGNQGGIGTTIKIDPPRTVGRVEAVRAHDGTVHLTLHES